MNLNPFKKAAGAIVEPIVKQIGNTLDDSTQSREENATELTERARIDSNNTIGQAARHFITAFILLNYFGLIWLDTLKTGISLNPLFEQSLMYLAFSAILYYFPKPQIPNFIRRTTKK